MDSPILSPSKASAVFEKWYITPPPAVNQARGGGGGGEGGYIQGNIRTRKEVLFYCRSIRAKEEYRIKNI